jgi:hypothetical protein
MGVTDVEGGRQERCGTCGAPIYFASGPVTGDQQWHHKFRGAVDPDLNHMPPAPSVPEIKEERSERVMRALYEAATDIVGAQVLTAENLEQLQRAVFDLEEDRILPAPRTNREGDQEVNADEMTREQVKIERLERRVEREMEMRRAAADGLDRGDDPKAIASFLRYISSEEPTPEEIEWARTMARERGWLGE